MQPLKTRKRLTPKMREAVEYYIMHPEATQTEVAKEVGIHLQTMHNWYHTDFFQEEIRKRLKEEWSNAIKIAQKTVIDEARNGNLRAAEYILDCNGYQAPQKLEVATEVIKVTIEDD